MKEKALKWARKQKYKAAVNLAQTTAKYGATEEQKTACRDKFEILKYICRVLEASK